MDSKSEKIALFRYGLIATLVIEPLPRGELTRRAREIAERDLNIPFSNRRSVSVDTLLDWALRYRTSGLEALAPKPRSDRGHTRTITPQLAESIERLKIDHPRLTGTAILRQLAEASPHGEPPLSSSTLYRFLKQHGLTQRQLLAASTVHKKFEAEFANQIWQSDMMFGPYLHRPEGGRFQCFLYAVLDDASRLVPHGEFYPSQALDALLDCFRQSVAARGLPIRFYVDNAKVYRSSQLARIAASLGILVVHTPPYRPQGRGKIERFFRTVREQFLAELGPRPKLTIEQLNTRFKSWLDTVYHRRIHRALGTTPLQRFQRDIERIRQLPPHTDWRRVFFYRLDRLVRKDSTCQLKKRFYEAPLHLAGQRVEVRFDPRDTSEVELYFQGKLQGMARAVEPVINAQLPRVK
jgi:transposase InsO family protein